MQELNQINDFFKEYFYIDLLAKDFLQACKREILRYNVVANELYHGVVGNCTREFSLKELIEDTCGPDVTILTKKGDYNRFPTNQNVFKQNGGSIEYYINGKDIGLEYTEIFLGALANYVKVKYIPHDKSIKQSIIREINQSSIGNVNTLDNIMFKYDIRDNSLVSPLLYFPSQLVAEISQIMKQNIQLENNYKLIIEYMNIAIYSIYANAYQSHFSIIARGLSRIDVDYTFDEKSLTEALLLVKEEWQLALSLLNEEIKNIEKVMELVRTSDKSYYLALTAELYKYNTKKEELEEFYTSLINSLEKVTIDFLECELEPESIYSKMFNYSVNLVRSILEWDDKDYLFPIFDKRIREKILELINQVEEKEYVIEFIFNEDPILLYPLLYPLLYQQNKFTNGLYSGEFLAGYVIMEEKFYKQFAELDIEGIYEYLGTLNNKYLLIQDTMITTENFTASEFSYVASYLELLTEWLQDNKGAELSEEVMDKLLNAAMDEIKGSRRKLAKK